MASPAGRCLSHQRLIMKRRKGELKYARSKRKNKGRKEKKKKKKKKKKNQVNNKKKQGGQTGKVNACAPVNFSRWSHEQWLETSWYYRKIVKIEER
jgi:hypothetical protein